MTFPFRGKNMKRIGEAFFSVYVVKNGQARFELLIRFSTAAGFVTGGIINESGGNVWREW